MNSCLQRIHDQMDAAVAGMTDEQMSISLNGRWTVAEIVEHLARAFGATVKGLERALAEPHINVRQPTLKERIAIAIVVEMGHLPSGRKAPEYTRPSGLAAGEALRLFERNLAAMDQALDRCERRVGDRLIAVHPILGPLTVNQWRKFHWVHSRHHLEQVRAIRDSLSQSLQAAA